MIGLGPIKSYHLFLLGPPNMISKQWLENDGPLPFPLGQNTLHLLEKSDCVERPRAKSADCPQLTENHLDKHTRCFSLNQNNSGNKTQKNLKITHVACHGRGTTSKTQHRSTWRTPPLPIIALWVKANGKRAIGISELNLSFYSHPNVSDRNFILLFQIDLAKPK